MCGGKRGKEQGHLLGGPEIRRSVLPDVVEERHQRGDCSVVAGRGNILGDLFYGAVRGTAKAVLCCAAAIEVTDHCPQGIEKTRHARQSRIAEVTTFFVGSEKHQVQADCIGTVLTGVGLTQPGS
jgi:hypothetical protein